MSLSAGNEQPVFMTGRENFAPVIGAFVFVMIGFIALSVAISRIMEDITIGGYSVSWGLFSSVILSAIVITYEVRKTGNARRLGLFRPKSLWRALAIGLIAPVVIYVLTALIITPLLSMGIITAPTTDGPSLVDGPNREIALFCSLALMWLGAAFGEELLFRGFLMNTLSRALGDGRMLQVVSAFIVAIAFGALHIFSQGMYGLVVPGIVGFMIGIVFILSKNNLFAVVIAHGLINSFGIIAGYLFS